ncbi:DUF481 domain-containing protein [Flavihumibacter fluvii]|uniref:DUF481 domain-containing protein n=1 Tax=Flavihumibacter fluvii TaxID=2838157 RepID=UPI001BDE9C8A|nr:DUF481 domain-containing protein [Flavihumibacter fluvii]ULQ54158.1 DUF481 domain-containing protein [Flavihumibacter fluvii]
MRVVKLAIFVAMFMIPIITMAQSNKDTLHFKNRNSIIGEIKSLDKGIVIVETDYSDKDFNIEWEKVKSIKTGTIFLITLTNGLRFNGTIESTGDSSKLLLKGRKAGNGAEETLESKLSEIVYLKGLASDFWSRAYANVDFGLDLTKANNLIQVNGRTKFGYLADKWGLDFSFDALRSMQDSVDATMRFEGNAAYTYYLPKDWLAWASINWLSNTEQALQLRTTAKLGAGKFLIHTNKKYWKALGGLSLNNETFSNETSKRTSLEGFVGSDLNLFDIGDLNLSNSVFVYPSFTEGGRWRSDVKLDVKYDFPKDFYLRVGVTVNYDNRPAEKGKETDYVLSFSVGWEL